MSPRRDNHTHFFSEETSESHEGGALVMWLKIGGRGQFMLLYMYAVLHNFLKKRFKKILGNRGKPVLLEHSSRTPFAPRLLLHKVPTGTLLIFSEAGRS